MPLIVAARASFNSEEFSPAGAFPPEKFQLDQAHRVDIRITELDGSGEDFVKTLSTAL